jgi:hypothetical protein
VLSVEGNEKEPRSNATPLEEKVHFVEATVG